MNSLFRIFPWLSANSEQFIQTISLIMRQFVKIYSDVFPYHVLNVNSLFGSLSWLSANSEQFIQCETVF